MFRTWCDSQQKSKCVFVIVETVWRQLAEDTSINVPRKNDCRSMSIETRNVRRVADEHAERDREPGEPGREGGREPRIDQRERDDTANRGDDGGHGRNADRKSTRLNSSHV